MKESIRPLDKALADLRQQLCVSGSDDLQEEAMLLMSLRAMLDCHPKPSWLKLHNGIIVYINEAYQAAFNKDPAEYQGAADSKLWDVHIADKFTQNDSKVAATGEPMRFIEMVTVDGEDRPHKILKWPVYLRGRLIGVAGHSFGEHEDGS